jgi:hypothetical protein
MRPAKCASHRRSSLSTYDQSAAIIATVTTHGVHDDINVGVRASVPFIAKLPFAVITCGVEGIWIAKVKSLVDNILGV